MEEAEKEKKNLEEECARKALRMSQEEISDLLEQQFA